MEIAKKYKKKMEKKKAKPSTLKLGLIRGDGFRRLIISNFIRLLLD